MKTKQKLLSVLSACALAFTALVSPISASTVTSKSVKDCDFVMEVNETIAQQDGKSFSLSGLPKGAVIDEVLVETKASSDNAQVQLAFCCSAPGYNENNWYSEGLSGGGATCTFLYTMPDEINALYPNGYESIQLQFWWGTVESVDITSIGVNYTMGDCGTGDVNGDGKLTVADVVLLSKHILVIEALPASAAKEADLDGSGTINTMDLTLLKRALIQAALSPTNSEAMQFVSNLTIGWNLGNTLDSTTDWIPNPSIYDFETCWGNPVTNKAMIDKVKSAGFNTVRVPVSWGQKMSGAPDYKVNDAWMNRVQEVVNYVIDNDMYCILNVHHDNDWLVPRSDRESAATAQLTKLWEQISARFGNYDEHLIFEVMNEPRLVGDASEWNGGNKEAREIINRYGAAALKTIRSSGGNNAERYVMLPPYAASPSTVTLNDFVLPEDDHIIVSVHSYSPYGFALDKEGTSSWAGSTSDKAELDSIFNYLEDRYISQGIPVIIGEFGAMNKENLTDRVRWAEYYVSAAKTRGIPCIWWDNNAFSGSGENFGLLNRGSVNFQYPELVDALMKGAKSK